MKKVIKTACSFCTGCCGIEVHVEDGRAVKVKGMREHPANQGRLCAKAPAIIDNVYSPDRLKYPMVKRGGEWHRISWDEALDITARTLIETKERYGARAVAVCFGMPFLSQGRATMGLIRRFTDVYGTANIFSVDSMCYRCRLIGYILTFGRTALADLENSRCIVVWGHNPNASCPHHHWRINQARDKGAQIIAIDPRRTYWAQKAELHAQPRPGTDCALALALLNVIISEGLYDREFVEKWTVGFDNLVVHVKQYSPEEVERITWVPAELIKKIARIYATTKPACILQGLNALDQKTSGIQNARAIAILQAITGNFDIPGGFVSLPSLPAAPLRMFDLVKEKPLGIEEFPLHYEVLGRVFGEGQGMVLPEAILTGKPYPIKAMIVAGSNPLLTWPNSNKIRESLKKLDFLLVMDMFMTPTAELAHLVLPAASSLERYDVIDLTYEVPYVMLRKKILQFKESWSDLKFWLKLAKRMGYDEHFPWEGEEEFLDYYLQPSGLSIKKLRDEQPGGFFYSSIEYGRYKKGCRTPSGKIELYSETLRRLGHDPLPTHTEPLESPTNTPELAKEYPLILTTGARILEFVHSQHRNIPRLRKRIPEPEMELHPATATRFGVKDGDWVLVETKRGSIKIKAKVTEDIVPGVANIAHGWAEANVNLLTDETPADPIVGNPSLKALLCRISKV